MPAPAVDVLAGAVGVGLPKRTVEGVGVGPESTVRLELPVFQIVFRLPARTGEVGDLIPRNARRSQLFDGSVVQVGHQVAVGNRRGAVPLSSSNDFEPEAAVLVNF